jgi:hypothetical protein
MGPVMLALDAELQENPIHEGESLHIPKFSKVVPPQADSGAVLEAAKMLVAAEAPLICQIAFNCDPLFASNNDPASVRNGRAETGGAEPRIAEQSRSWRAAGGEGEVMRGS